jgi:Family of unknown function (DUF6527)
MRRSSVKAEFVEFIPDVLDDGVVYVSEKYGTALHRCCCGCGSEVVTPLSPVEWQLRRTGDTITLSPSIGNWSSPCQAHYFIRGNRVVWARAMDATEIEAVRRKDRRDKAAHIAHINSLKDEAAKTYPRRFSILTAIRRWLRF